jgi:hypothetical protein
MHNVRNILWGKIVVHIFLYFESLGEIFPCEENIIIIIIIIIRYDYEYMGESPFGKEK